MSISVQEHNTLHRCEFTQHLSVLNHYNQDIIRLIPTPYGNISLLYIHYLNEMTIKDYIYPKKKKRSYFHNLRGFERNDTENGAGFFLSGGYPFLFL